MSLTSFGCGFGFAVLWYLAFCDHSRPNHDIFAEGITARSRVLVPLPSKGFDPWTVAVPWDVLTDLGFEVVFATPHGNVSTADVLALEPPPSQAWLTPAVSSETREAYERLLVSAAFRRPLPLARVVPSTYDGLLLAGGHPGHMRRFAKSSQLQACRLFVHAPPPRTDGS